MERASIREVSPRHLLHTPIRLALKLDYDRGRITRILSTQVERMLRMQVVAHYRQFDLMCCQVIKERS